MVARRVRCRAGASRGPPVSTWQTLFRVEQISQGEETNSRRGQLDRQRQTVQALADLAHHRGVGSADIDGRIDGLRPLDEEGRRFGVQRKRWAIERASARFPAISRVMAQ